MDKIEFSGKPVLLDGGLGRELRFRGVAVPTTIWSAAALMSAPEEVRRIHLDYIAAGADIITANTYGVIRSDLAKVGIEDRFAELNILACDLAVQARDASSRQVMIAGSLPPLGGSFRPDRVGSSD
ncbi:MAG: homocysteine S-methyltransferase family protein, partial [Deltaproteobacteria bacterium]|nr:homocysteine S-methyltransferase family protein [Deltaproteobacteria bacterium]